MRQSSDWGVPAWVGAMIRANDKVKRLQTFAAKGELLNEPVEDSLLDLAVYAIIALVLYEAEKEKVHPQQLSFDFQTTSSTLITV